MSAARLNRLPPWLRALTAHLVALASIAVCVWISIRIGRGIPPLAAIAGEALLAAAGGVVLKLPRWWLPLQLLLAPAVFAAHQLNIDPVYYLAAFAGTALLMGNSIGDRVPLFLSSRSAWQWLSEQTPANGTMIDLGCGTGQGIVHISRLRADVQCYGIESSPLLWLIACLRTAGRPNCHVVFGSLWRVDLAPFDVVYAFLSPAPMARLWAKACSEMEPGAAMVSNSFEVPGVAPDRTIRLRDRRRSRMLLWHMRNATRSEHPAGLAVGGSR